MSLNFKAKADGSKSDSDLKCKGRTICAPELPATAVASAMSISRRRSRGGTIISEAAWVDAPTMPTSPVPMQTGWPTTIRSVAPERQSDLPKTAPSSKTSKDLSKDASCNNEEPKSGI